MSQASKEAEWRLWFVNEMEQPLPLSTVLAALCVGVGLGGTLIQVMIRLFPG